MDRKIIDVPKSIFPPNAQMWSIDVRGRAASDSVTGAGQVVYGTQPRWIAELGMVHSSRESLNAWSAVVAQLRGRVNLLRIGVCDPKSFSPVASVPHSDGTPFDDGSEYSTGVGFFMSVSASAGDTSVTLPTTAATAGIQVGYKFSVDDYLYMVTGIYAEPTTTRIEFEPPLKTGVNTETPVEFDAYVIMALETDDQGQVRFQTGRFGRSTMRVLEWTNRDG